MMHCNVGYKNRITIAEATEVQQLIKAPSRNRAVFRLRGSFFGSFSDKQKRTDKHYELYRITGNQQL